MHEEHHQTSYIRRRGRQTKAQERGLAEFADGYRVSPQQAAELAMPLGMEIGFGMGQALLEWAEQAPDWQLLGVELYQPGVGALAANLHKQQIDNVHILELPAQEVVAQLPPGVLAEVRVYFPDPWPKKRHAKRRLIQPEFIAALTTALQVGGVLKVATDWAPYAAWMREVFATEARLRTRTDSVRGADEHPSVRSTTTKFERRGQRLGHEITDFILVRQEFADDGVQKA